MADECFWPTNIFADEFIYLKNYFCVKIVNFSLFDNKSYSDKEKSSFSLKRQILVKNIRRLKVTKFLASDENFNQWIFLTDESSDRQIFRR